MSTLKEKSWSVRLVNGFIVDNKVKAERCRNCEGTAKLIAARPGEPEALLYGCNGHKCRHVLIRFQFSVEEPEILPEVSEMFSSLEPTIQQNSANPQIPLISAVSFQ